MNPLPHLPPHLRPGAQSGARAAGPIETVPQKQRVVKQLPSRSAEEIARLETICGACNWNVNWICEHPGCLPCRQRMAGGLKAMIAMPSSRCPDKPSRWL